MHMQPKDSCAFVMESRRSTFERHFYDLPRSRRLAEMFVLPRCRRDIMFSTCERKEIGDRGWNRGTEQQENGGKQWKEGKCMLF